MKVNPRNVILLLQKHFKGPHEDSEVSTEEVRISDEIISIIEDPEGIKFISDLDFQYADEGDLYGDEDTISEDDETEHDPKHDTKYDFDRMEKIVAMADKGYSFETIQNHYRKLKFRQEIRR